MCRATRAYSKALRACRLPVMRSSISFAACASRDTGISPPSFATSAFSRRNSKRPKNFGDLHQHLTELASNYGPLGILWVDYSSAGNEGSHWGTRSILDIWRTHQSAAILNNRFWSGLENPYGDFFTPETEVGLVREVEAYVGAAQRSDEDVRVQHSAWPASDVEAAVTALLAEGRLERLPDGRLTIARKYVVLRSD